MAELNNRPPVSRSSRTKQKGKKRRIWMMVLTISLFVIGILIVIGALLVKKGFDVVDQIALPSGGETSVTESVYSSPPKGKADVDVRNILLLGTDNRPSLGSLNTDVIMLVSLRPDTKSAVIASIPRDTYLDPTGWKENKANSFYAAARRYDKDDAYNMVREIFSEFFTVPIDYVVEVDFKAFEEIVDAIGGIKVDVDMDMRYVDPTDGTNINLTQGEQLLSGKQALDYVRYRQSNDGTRQSSDFERNARQQQVVTAIVGKMKTFEAVIRVFEVLDAVGANIKTTIPRDEILTLIRTYVGIDTSKIEFLRLEGTWRSPFVWPKDESLTSIRETLNKHMTIEQ